MTTIDIKCELQEIARKIRIFEKRVDNYEEHPQYVKLSDRQLFLYKEYARISSLEKQTLSSQGMSLWVKQEKIRLADQRLYIGNW